MKYAVKYFYEFPETGEVFEDEEFFDNYAAAKDYYERFADDILTIGNENENVVLTRVK